MATLDIAPVVPESREPHVVNFTGFYQTDPGDLPEGTDWRSATWTESVRFLPQAPWEIVNSVIAGVGQTAAGDIIISGGVDLSRFLVGAAIDEDQPKVRALLRDRNRAMHRKYVSEVILFLVEQYSGGKAGIVSAIS